ncbi:MAG: matrixin family metalloprotease [Polyangiaceae bacterium]|nr:matrixin family metalloprotease [Polyangiaceae bacterium]
MLDLPVDPVFAGAKLGGVGGANDLVGQAKFLWQAPLRLTVGFLDLAAGEAELGPRIVGYMNRWSEHADVKFTQTDYAETADIRIARAKGQRCWSYVGKHCRSVPTGQATMNLEGFTLDTPASELERVVVHEAGHCLGFEHEHLRRAIVKRINPKEAYFYFGVMQGWSPPEVDLYVLTPLEEASSRGTAYVDLLSIMCYPIPGWVMHDGIEVPGGAKLDASDIACVAELYPFPPDYA